MNKGQYTLAQLNLSVGITYQTILDCKLKGQAGEHGVCEAVLQLSENTKSGQISALIGNQGTVTLDGKTLLKGTITQAGLKTANGYHSAKIVISTDSIKADKKKESCVFQDPGKHLSDMVNHVLKGTGISAQLQKDIPISHVVYQKQETAWQFIKRLSAQYQYNVYADFKSKTIVIGEVSNATYPEEDCGKIQTVEKDIAELRRVQSNQDSTAASYAYESQSYISTNLFMATGEHIGKHTIQKHYLHGEKGILVNEISLKRSSDSLPSYQNQSGSTIVSGIVTGTVTAVDGNQIQVTFDSHGGLTGSSTWIPYESAISNHFYCMPDIGDKAFIYYENNGKIICMGSKRASDTHPDYDKPEEKVLTNHDKMIKFTTTGLNISTTRELHDNGSDMEISIKMDEEEGITITSGQDIKIHTDQNIRIAAGKKKPKEHNAQLQTGKEKFAARDKKGAAEYAADSGIAGNGDFMDAMKTKADTFLGDVKESFIEGGKSLIFYDLWGGSDTQIEKAEQEVVCETGVISLYAREELTITVGNSEIHLGEDVTFTTPEFRWLGYEQTKHEKVEEELKDWWEVALDGLQLGLDILGFIPGIGDALDLVNAGISLARGDYFGAASSLVSAIPGVGSFIGGGMKAVKAGTKAAKAISKISKAVSKATKIIRKAEEFYNALNSIASILRVVKDADVYLELAKDIFSGKFDITNPKDADRLMQVAQLASPFVKTKLNKKYKKHQAKKHGGDIEPQKQRKKGNESEQDKQTCKHDPINVVTGSQTLIYTDFVIHDITGDKYLHRTYESIYENQGNLFGAYWMSEFDANVTVQEDLTVVQMPDMHLIRFQKTEQGYENLQGNKTEQRLFDTPEGYVLQDNKQGIRMYFGHNGKLTCTEDKNHNKTRYQYEADVLQRIEYPGGQYFDLTLEKGKITEITDIIGRKLYYEYEGEFLTKVTLANGGSIHYDYTAEGYIHSVTDQNGKTYVTNHYDRKGRVVRQELSNGEEYVVFYDDVAKKNTFVTTATGNQITYSYGMEKLPTITTYEDGTYEEKRYDQWYNVVYERDRNGSEITRIYDSTGNLLEETLPNGLKTVFTYNEAGEMLSCTDNAGREEFYTYDPAGNMIQKSRRLDSKTLQTYTYRYDNAGRMLSETDPEGNETIYTYETDFAMYSIRKNAEGTELRYTYDKAGRNMMVENEFGTLHYGYNDVDFVTKEEDEEGNETRYDYDRLCNLIRKVSPNARATGTATGTSTLSGTGTATIPPTRYEYDDMDCLIREISPMGRIKAYVNDSEGNVVKEVNPNLYSNSTKDGIGILHKYDKDGNRIQTIYPTGEAEYFRYDSEGNMTDYIRPEAYAKDGENAKGTHYIYDEVGRLTGIQNEEGIMEHTFVYDLCGNIVKEIDAKGYELGETNEERVGTLYTYNLAGWMLEKREPVKVTEKDSESDRSNEIGKTNHKLEVSYRLTTYEYDKNGNLIKEKRFLDYQNESSRNGRIHVISYEYDKINRITRVTDTTGAELRYTYNSRNALTSIKEKMEEGKWREMHYFYTNNGRLERMAETADKEGSGKGYAQTWYEYDANGNVVKITTPSGNEIKRTYDADNLLIREEHKELGGDIQNCFTYEYDKAENLVKVTDVYGIPVQYEYDTRNRLVSMTGKNGGITKLAYDKNDRIKRVILPREVAEHGENAKGYRYQYDTQDRITSLTACDGTLLYERTYTPYGELEQEIDNAGSGIRFVYDYIGRRIQVNTTGNAKETYEYDATGNLTATTDGNGNTTRFQVDAWGRIQEILKADESKETYEYDLAGNMISATDGENHQVRYSYNHAGNLSSRTDASGNTEYFNYDIEGRLHKHRDRNGSETHLYYNMYHDPIRREHKESGLQEIYSYRKDGSLSYAIGGGMRYDYTYYPDGKLHEKKASGKVLLSYEYDLNGNRIRQSDITGKSTTYTYNALDLLEEIRDNKFSARYQYHSNGTIKSLSVGDKLSTHYEYDKDKNLTRQWTKMAGEVEEDKRIQLGIPRKDANNMTLLADYHYSYDGNGNRIRKEALTGKTSYQYDTLNRLVKVEYPHSAEEFAYDKADNRIRRLTETQEELYKYDVCNRLVEKQTRRLADNVAGTSVNAGQAISLEKIKPQGSCKQEEKLPTVSSRRANLIPFHTSTFQYDNQGNLLREERKSGESRQESIYSYDGFNRQKKIVNFESKVQVNHYDGEGLRHEMEENGNLVKFLYADREVVAEEKEDGNVIRFIRGYDLVASDSESARTYYHYACDEQGSITHVLGEDETGEYSLKNYYEYGAFGDFKVKEEEVENRFGYNGEIFDPIGGQYYLRARYYNPVIGRFTQEDTYYGDGLNLYVYCRNLPIGYEDPSGHICEEKYNALKDKEKSGKKLTAEERKLIAEHEKQQGKNDSNSENIVYRALNQKDYDRLTQGLGLEAKNPNGAWSLKEHLISGSSKKSWENDPFISTTTDLNVARGFNESGSGLGIVAIDLNKITTNTYKGYEIFPRTNGVEGLPYHYSVWQQEVSVYQNIPLQAIVDYFN
ncbi:MAG: hypothetical protein IJF03_12060 [Lachnospiraceae bacterium]|nr:hypothetical protein [Lachnospiraceae bacterium]